MVQPIFRRWGTVVLAVLLVVSLPTGAVTAQQATAQEATLTIGPDGSIESFYAAIVVPNQTYESMRANLPDEHDSVAEALAEDIVASEAGVDAYDEAADVQTDGGYRIEITFTGIDDLDGFSTQVANGTVHVAVDDPDQIVSAEDLETNVFTVEMPGTILESTAHEVSGDTATWRLHESTPSSITATASIADNGSGGDAEPPDDGTDDTDNQTDDGSGGGSPPAGDDGNGDDDPPTTGGDAEPSENSTDENESQTGDDTPVDDANNGSSDGDDTADDNESPADGGEQTDDDDSSSDDGMPGFGIGLAIAALLGSAFLVNRR